MAKALVSSFKAVTPPTLFSGLLRKTNGCVEGAAQPRTKGLDARAARHNWTISRSDLRVTYM